MIFTYNSKSKNDVKSVNSKFDIDISQYGVKVLVKPNDKINKGFELFSPGYENKYLLKSNSNILNFALKGKEEEVLKRIFVKISDCPEWSQSMLYEIRQKQLEKKGINNSINIKMLKKER